MREEFGIETKIGELFAQGSSEDDEVKINVFGYKAKYVYGTFKLRAHDMMRWVKPDELGQYQFPHADNPLVKKLAGK